VKSLQDQIQALNNELENNKNELNEVKLENQKLKQALNLTYNNMAGAKIFVFTMLLNHIMRVMMERMLYFKLPMHLTLN